MSWHHVLSCAAVGLLSACSASRLEHRDPELGVDVPPRWTAASPDASTGEPTTEWWQSFGDPQLAALIDEALSHNHDLRAAAARLDAAVAQRAGASAELWPRLGAEGDASRQRQNFVGFPIPGAGRGQPLSRTFNNFGIGLTSSWELDIWGRLRAGHDAAFAELEAAGFDLVDAHESLAAQTARAYFALLEARLQVELAQRTVDSYRATADLVRDRFERGARPSLDLRLALNMQSSGEAQLESRRRAWTLARRELELLLGRYPDGSVASPASLPELPDPPPAGLPAALLTRRPDVSGIERRLAAATRRIDAIRAEFYPRISLTSSAGTRSDELSDLLDSDFFVWNLAGNLLAPIFDAGRVRARVDAASAQARELAATYAQVALRAYTEVESALASEELLARREQHLAEADRQAQAALDLADDRYRRGVGDFLSVLDAQRRALTASSALLDVRRRRLDVRVDLHLALGGAFPAPPETDHFPEDRAAVRAGDAP